MTKSRFSEEKIIGILKEQEAGVLLAEPSRLNLAELLARTDNKVLTWSNQRQGSLLDRVEQVTEAACCPRVTMLETRHRSDDGLERWLSG